VDVSLIAENVLAWAQHFTWILQAFAVVLVTLIVGSIVRRFVNHLSKRTRTTDTFIDDALFYALRGPSRGLVWVIGISLAAHIVSQETEAAILDAIPIIRDIGVIAILTWFLIRFARSYEDHYVQQEQARGQKVDWTFIRAIGRIVRAAIFITATLVVLQTLGISISGLLAFGGMGGIAVGLAARDILANVFGGLTIYLDRPFAVGDWIRSPDREIEGDVEEIGWRRTLIRTFDMRPLYVPNAVFTTISVENPSRMHNRRIFETIGVRYNDVNHVPAILADIRKYLTTSPLIDSSRTLMVNFNQFSPSTLDFFIYCFTKTVVWTEYHAVKEEVLLKIADIVAQHGAEMAFPTSTIHIPHELQVTEKNNAQEKKT
tara:strand:+ start:3173 stop:4294 length:1122 start_codon:yes stop_codon:yes gene_type:complete